jgi:DnaJ-class molecular chaperone
MGERVMADICDKHKIKQYAPDCARCDGEGVIETDDDLLFPRGTLERCYACAGTGFSPWTECELCNEDAWEEDAAWMDSE